MVGNTPIHDPGSVHISGIQPGAENDIEIGQADPSLNPPAKPSVLDQIKNSRGLEVAKAIIKPLVGLVAAVGLIALLPVESVLYLLIAGFGAPFGAHIPAGQDEHGIEQKMDSIDVANAMRKLYREAVISTVKWMLSTKPAHTPNTKVEEAPIPPDYSESDFVLSEAHFPLHPPNTVQIENEDEEEDSKPIDQPIRPERKRPQTPSTDHNDEEIIDDLLRQQQYRSNGIHPPENPQP